MKRKLYIFAGMSAASLLAFPVLAQETLDSKTVETASARHNVTQACSERLNSAVKATDVIGMTVNDYRNEKIGIVKDLAVDVESGRIVQVMLFTGGFSGRSNAFVAVPPEGLQYDAAAKALQLNACKGKFAAGLKFDTSKWDADTQLNRVAEVHGYYGEQPYYVADNDGYRNPNRGGTLAATLPHNMDGSIKTDGARAMDTASKVEVAGGLEATNNWISTRNPDGIWTREYYSAERRVNNSWSRLGYVRKAGGLLGEPVKNLQGQELGKVEDLVVDLSAGRIVAVIISTGGFLDLRDELSAVPPTALRFNSGHDILQLDASRELLAASPHFNAGAWPDLSQPGYAGAVYHAYDIDPWFSPAAATGTDAALLNVRDRDNGAVSTPDQRNRQADVDTEAQIRREIIADHGMSANAKKVRITAIDGRVILCGLVDSAGEKRIIGEIANRIAHVGNVDNQLDVMFTTTSSN
jgi:sporulation protein YlmC with PRC-barrel domain